MKISTSIAAIVRGGAVGFGDGDDDDKDKGLSAAEAKKLREQLTTLQASVEALEANNLALKQEKADEKKKRQKEEEERSRQNGDLEALEASYKKKIADAEQAGADKIAKLEGMVRQLTVDANATTLAQSLAVDADAIPALLPHIRERLSVDMTGDKAVLRVMVDGKPSALTVDDLKGEITANTAFSRLVKASDGSGDGGAGDKVKGKAPKQVTRAEFDQMDPGQRMKFVNEDGGKVVDAA